MQCAKFYISKMIELGEESLSELLFIKVLKTYKRREKLLTHKFLWINSEIKSSRNLYHKTISSSLSSCNCLLCTYPSISKSYSHYFFSERFGNCPLYFAQWKCYSPEVAILQLTFTFCISSASS